VDVTKNGVKGMGMLTFRKLEGGSSRGSGLTCVSYPRRMSVSSRSTPKDIQTIGEAPVEGDEGGRRDLLLSIIVPMFNEGADIERFLGRLLPVLARLDGQGEIICVNDGSSDGTLAALLAARHRDARIKILDLSRNFGKELAVTAGLMHAGGDVAILLDADLQHPPEAIPEMLAKWAEGFEIVHMVRSGNIRGRPLDRWLRRLFYLSFHLLTEVRLPSDASDYLLLDRRVIDVVRQMPERSRFMKGIYNWVGFRQAGIPYVEAERQSGASKWKLLRLIRLAMDGISAFSNLPLKIWGFVGAAVAGLSLTYAVIRVLRAVFVGIDVPGYESIIVAILFLGGMQLLTLGIIGSYIGRIFDEVKGRPLYIVREAYGFEDGRNPKGAPDCSRIPAFE
jgi:glycosyltransferase involved in cell wall biosynthesis